MSPKFIVRFWIRALTSAGLLVILAASLEVVNASDFNKGRELYDSLGCVGCHGDKAGSLLAGYPSFVGASADFIVGELNKYRHGVRKDPTMGAMAAGLSDQNVEDLSDYIANR